MTPILVERVTVFKYFSRSSIAALLVLPISSEVMNMAFILERSTLAGFYHYVRAPNVPLNNHPDPFHLFSRQSACRGVDGR